jgi:hypothetical protein
LEVYHALLDDRLREWSIGYGITSEHTATWNGEQVQVLTEVELLEISCVHKGANRLTRTLDIKTADTKPAVNRQALKDLVTVGKAMLGDKARPPLSEGVDEAIVVSLAQAHLVFDHGMPEAEVLAMSYDEMRAVHPSEHERGADHEHDVMTTEGETSAEPEPNDPKRYAKMLDDLENTNAGPAPDPDAVDRSVTETGQVMVEEKPRRGRADGLGAADAAQRGPGSHARPSRREDAAGDRLKPDGLIATCVESRTTLRYLACSFTLASGQPRLRDREHGGWRS